MWECKKPWGLEIIHVITPEYCLKELIIKKGHETSTQYHKNKTESWIIDGKVMHIQPGEVHNIKAVKRDVRVWEVSSLHLMDVVRISDKYGRKA